MKLKVKKMDWSSGNSLICILNTEDAARLNAHLVRESLSEELEITRR